MLRNAPVLALISLFSTLASCSGKEAPEKEPEDSDGDGVLDEDDCAPDNAEVSPNATEVCDGVDNNCSGSIDEGLVQTWYADFDHDGYGDKANAFARCEKLEGYTLDKTDCDDLHAEAHPGGTEVCDDLDNDCNDAVDDGIGDLWGVDGDGDGWGLTGDLQACSPPSGYGTEGDCDDGDAEVHPGGKEVCDDGKDSDCNGEDGLCPVSIDDVDDAIYRGEADESYAGYQGQAVGDLNGDGVGDLAIAAIGINKYRGAVYVISGPPASGSHDLGTDATARIVGATDYALLGGGGVGSMGDRTGDGFDDLAIGAQDYAGAAATLTIVDGPLSGDLDLGAALGDVEITMPATTAFFLDQPRADVSGDGEPDLLVAVYDDSSYAGSLYVIPGPVASGSTDLSGAGAYAFTGTGANEAFGFASVLGGDVDGDGADDLLVGAFAAHKLGTGYVIPGGTGSGGVGEDLASSVWLPTKTNYGIGQSAVPLGDVNDDGYADFGFSDPYDYTYGIDKKTGQTHGAVYVAYGPAAGSHTVTEADGIVYGNSGDFAGAFLDAADVDGDGKQDLLVQAWSAYDGHGAAYAISSPIDGIHFLSEYQMLYGQTANDFQYGSIGSAGDTDGDGKDDFLVGAALALNGTAVGQVYLVLGGSY